MRELQQPFSPYISWHMLSLGRKSAVESIILWIKGINCSTMVNVKDLMINMINLWMMLTFAQFSGGRVNI